MWYYVIGDGMQTRMEKYYKNNRKIEKRSSRNSELYTMIYEDSKYSNIEGIADIEKTNEIDLSKIKELLKKHESYRKENPTIIKEAPTISYEPKIEEEKNYDLKDVLGKARDNKVEDDKKRTLSNTQYNILKSINVKDQSDFEEHGLREMNHTITNREVLNNLADGELSLDLLEDLKSTDCTITGESQTINSLIKEARENEIREAEENTEHTIDSSFFSSSMKFNKNDFEDLQDINHTFKENNFLIKMLLIILFVIIIIASIFLIINFVL